METVFKVVGWLNKIVVVCFVFAAFWSIFAFLRKKSRPAYGFYLYAISYLLGFNTWLLCVVVLHDIWGYTGLIAGVLLAGIGVVPLCLLAVSIHGQWAMLGSLLFSLALIAVSRLGGTALQGKKQELNERDLEWPDDEVAFQIEPQSTDIHAYTIPSIAIANTETTEENTAHSGRVRKVSTPATKASIKKREVETAPESPLAKPKRRKLIKTVNEQESNNNE